MKEHVQKPGVRKWAGEDLIELQGESLTAIQALVEPYAPCIVQGCEVSHENGVYQVKPGIVALRGSNEDGNACTKIVRFAGYTGEILPIYLTIKVTPYMRVYADEENKPIAYEYTAEPDTNQPAVPYLKIDADGGARLVDTIGITQKLDREGGNASNVKVVSFKEYSSEERNNIEAGSSLKELFGKIRRWFNDLGKLAFKDTVGKSDFDDTLTTAFNNKVDKDGSKVLSECDFTKAYEDKLKGIAKNAEVNVRSDWGETDTESDAFIKNKPTSLPANGGTAETISTVLPITKGGTGASAASTAVTNLLSGASNGTVDPTDAAYFIVSGNGTTTYYRKPLSLLWNWIKSKLKTVATSGSYNDLSDKPNTATQSVEGFMSAADKKKLDGIAAGANATTVDVALSNNSTNPVQNRAVKTALDGKADSSHTHDYLPNSGGTITGNVTMKGSVRLQRPASSTNDQYLSPRLNFGDGEEVYMEEATDGYLTIYAKNGIVLNTSKGPLMDFSDKLIGYASTSRNIYPGDTMTMASNNLTFTICGATEQLCKIGARAYIYQASTTNCVFNIANISSALVSVAAKNQVTVNGNTVALKQGMGLWTITWLRDLYVWIDFTALSTVIK